MHNTSDLWKEIVEEGNYSANYKLVIDSVEYDDIDSIISMSETCDVFGGTSPVLGDCVSSRTHLSLITTKDIPKGAECVIKMQIVSNDGSKISEWIDCGSHYISKRKKKDDMNVVTFDTFDAIRHVDQLMYVEEGDQEEWPKTDIEVLDYISEVLGLQFHSSVEDIVVNEYEIQYPGYGEDGFTIRQVLGYIAAMYCGNWIVDDNGYLKLLRLFDYSDDPIDLSDSHDSFEFSDKSIRYSRVTIDAGDNTETGEPIQYTVGDDTYSELLIECPWGTYEIAEDILESLSGYEYKPFTSSNTVIDPAFEIGDSVIFDDGNIYQIFSYEKSYDNLFTSVLSAPFEDEQEDEYPYKTKEARQRSIDRTYYKARLKVTADSISSEVTKVQNDTEILSTQVQQLADGIDIRIRTAVEEGTEDLEERVGSLEEFKETHFSFTQEGFGIRASDSSMDMLLTNDTLKFRDSGNDVAWYGAGTAHMKSAEVEKTFKIGDWIFDQAIDGTLMLRWGGTS